MNSTIGYSLLLILFLSGISVNAIPPTEIPLEDKMKLTFSDLCARKNELSISTTFIDEAFVYFLINYRRQNIDMLVDALNDGVNECIFLKLSKLNLSMMDPNIYEYVIDVGEFFLERIYSIPSQENYNLYCIASYRITDYHNAVFNMNLRNRNESKQLVRLLKKHINDKNIEKTLAAEALLSSIYDNLDCMDNNLLSIIIDVYTERLNELKVSLTDPIDFCINDGNTFRKEYIYNYIYLHMTGHCRSFKHKYMQIIISHILHNDPINIISNNNKFMEIIDTISISPKNNENIQRWKQSLVGKNIFLTIALMDPTNISIELFGIIERAIKIFYDKIIEKNTISAEEFGLLIFEKPADSMLMRTMIHSLSQLCIHKKFNLYIISRNLCTIIVNQTIKEHMDIYDEVIFFIKIHNRNIFTRNIVIENERVTRLFIESIDSHYTKLANLPETNVLDNRLEISNYQSGLLDDIMEYITDEGAYERVDAYTQEMTNTKMHMIFSNLLDSNMVMEGNIMIKSRLNLAFSAATMIVQCSGMIDNLDDKIHNTLNFNFLRNIEKLDTPEGVYLKQEDNLPIDLLETLPAKFTKLVNYIKSIKSTQNIDQRFLTTIILIADDIFPKHDLTIHDELTQVLKSRMIIIADYLDTLMDWGNELTKMRGKFLDKVFHFILDVISLRYFNKPGQIYVKRIYCRDPIKSLIEDPKFHMTDIYSTYNVDMMIRNIEPTFISTLSLASYFLFKDDIDNFDDAMKYLAQDNIPPMNKFIVTLIGNEVHHLKQLFPSGVTFCILRSVIEIETINIYMEQVKNGKIAGVITHRIPNERFIQDYNLKQHVLPPISKKSPLFRAPSSNQSI